MSRAIPPRRADEVTTLFLLSRVDCVDGVAGYLETVIEGIRSEGDQVVIVSGPVSTPDGSDRRMRGIQRVALDWLVIDDFAAKVPNPLQVARIFRFIRAHNVKVIAPQGFKMLPYARLLSRLAGRLPVVAHYHPSAHATSIGQIAAASARGSRSYKMATGLFGADRYIAASAEVRAFFERDCGIAPKQITDQPFGIADATYRVPQEGERREARETLNLSDSALVCVLPGRLNSIKGHDVAVDAVRALRRRRPDLDVVCLFAGGGDQRAEIEATAFQSENDRAAFRFLGFVPSANEMRTVFWASDVCLLPSRFESFAIAIVEAMACGVVPIRTPSGGHRDQITDGSNGFIVPFDDAVALATRIEELGSEPLRFRMGAAAAYTAHAKFTQQAMARGTNRLFREAAGMAA